MDSISTSNAMHIIPDGLTRYENALPKLPSYCDPGFSGNTTGVDSAGNYDEPQPSKAKEMEQKVAESMNVYRRSMKAKNFWHLDDPIVKNMNNFIEKHLPSTEKEGGANIQDPDGDQDGIILEPSDNTPTDRRRVIKGQSNTPKKPYDMVTPRHQRPKTLFEMKTNRKDPNPMPNRETFYHMGKRRRRRKTLNKMK